MISFRYRSAVSTLIKSYNAIAFYTRTILFQELNLDMADVDKIDEGIVETVEKDRAVPLLPVGEGKFTFV